MLDLQLKVDSRPGRYQVVTSWMGDCLQTGKLSRYVTKTKTNSAFHLSGVGKSSTSLLAGVKMGHVHLSASTGR